MGKTCNQDVNECGLKPRPCKHRCMNTIGSYKCYCLNGYMQMPDGTCRNARTCAMANCQYGCEVMKGEVRCQCPSPGLRLGPDRRTCVDIDECMSGKAKCPRFRKCVNTFGSYICKCHVGFDLHYVNGKYQCVDQKDRSICYEKPGSRKCKCKVSANGRGYDCKPIIKVTVEPPRPEKTTVRPTTSVNIPTTYRSTTITSTTARSPTTARPTTTTPTPTTTTIPTTNPTTTITTTAIPTTTTTPTTTKMTTTIPTTTTAVMTAIPTTTSTTTITTTELPTTSTQRTTTTTVATTTPELILTTTTAATRAIPATTTVATTSLPTTSITPTGSTTLDNRIQKEITARPRGDVHIPRNPGQNNLFDLDFDIELGNTADYARDEPDAGSLRCSFDRGVCSWLTDQEGDVRWETKEDPAGGRYLTIPEAVIGRSVRGARLTLPLTSLNSPPWQVGNLCLSFRHHLHGHHVGSLQLFVRKGRGQSPAIWTRTGGHGWRHTQITLWGRGLNSVVLKGERRRGRKGEIAIDDFSVRQGPCHDLHNPRKE
ncbi:nephronectin [Chanos chanos]|uniref:Nephronectin n=1 Tax=Chanos chanos TaxID=29144 RepID=A0A6J2VHP2_CHACN|nr:nephronectin-like [Chanos chanos]